MATLSMELTNLTADTLQRLSEKARQQGIDRVEEYVSALVMRDIGMGTEAPLAESSETMRLRLIFDCIRQLSQTKDCTAAELDILFAHALKEARQMNGIGLESSDDLKTPLLGENHPLAKAAGSMSGETWNEFMAELDRIHEASLLEA